MLRFVPLYYLAIILYGYFLWGIEQRPISVVEFLTHLLFMNGLFPQYANSIVGGGWYLATLVLFYVLTPLLYKYINTLEKAIAFFSVSIAISYGACRVGGICIDPIYSDYNWYFSIWAQLPIWTLGMVLYYLLFKSEWQLCEVRKIASYGFLLLAIVILLGEILERNDVLFISIYLRYALGFALLIISQWIHSNRLICNRLTEIIGRNSFSIYLYHMLIIRIYDKANLIYVKNQLLDWGIKYIFVMLITFVTAVLLTQYLDKPLYRKIIDLYGKLTTKRENC